MCATRKCLNLFLNVIRHFCVGTVLSTWPIGPMLCCLIDRVSPQPLAFNCAQRLGDWRSISKFQLSPMSATLERPTAPELYKALAESRKAKRAPQVLTGAPWSSMGAPWLI